MKNLISIVLVLVLAILNQAQTDEIGSLIKNVEFNFPAKIQQPLGNPVVTGTYTIGNTGDFPTIDSAFNKLSIDGIAGNVTFELIDTLYTSLTNDFGFFLNGPIPGTGPNSRVTIKPAVNKNVTLESNSYSVLFFYNTSYVTLDGVGLDGATSLKIHSLQNTQYESNDGITFLNNSSHNVIQNINVECEDYTRLGCGILLWHYSGNFSPDSNLVQNNFINKAAIGISVISSFYRVTRDTVRGNIIGSETERLISWGINILLGQYTVVENNLIQNVGYNPSFIYNPGIVSVAGVGDLIRNNVVHNVFVNDGNYGGIGILLRGTSSLAGVNNKVYNNMIYDIQSASPQPSATVSGIELRDQSFPKIYYNSVYLSGSGTNQSGSAALYIGNNCSYVYLINNILVNTRDESPYCASVIYNADVSNLISNYNDLYYDESNQLNYLVRAGGFNYRNLSDWQAMNKDLNSYTEMPNFVEPYLHINGSIDSYLNSGGTPIGGINKDFDGDPRNATTPDIGADEFDVFVEVEEETFPLTEFVLEQNYPNPFNPTTTIKYQIPELNFVTLKVYDVLGREVADILNEEKPAGTYQVQFDASGLSSGTYFYRLKAGKNVETKKMLLVK